MNLQAWRQAPALHLLVLESNSWDQFDCIDTAMERQSRSILSSIQFVDLREDSVTFRGRARACSRPHVPQHGRRPRASSGPTGTSGPTRIRIQVRYSDCTPTIGNPREALQTPANICTLSFSVTSREVSTSRINRQTNSVYSMGDRSPKSVQKQASQKQSKANESDRKKQALVTSQQATKAKAAASKKK